MRTAASGEDATGQLPDDSLWANIYALPYAARHPDLTFVVTDDRDEPIGYVLGTDDTDAFERWFAAEYWPAVAHRWPERGNAEDEVDLSAEQAKEARLVGIASGIGSHASPHATRYPAHLHIDLLPQAQGSGWGRKLIDALADALRERGVPGIHLGVGVNNANAIAFYQHLGFVPLNDDSTALGYDLTVAE
ncbi:GNAT family N-acetyltransferase [Agromyces archimandritae]|uniref:GNAT family N-acetyltransferase n=1 Tax=Agromyces archimandritae TaxID=2781962 RepID=UPI001FD429A7|nr:GNAT family N-acetyltransferase [Agromyces archimandritae]